MLYLCYSSTIHTNAVENHEASNGEEPVQKSSQPNTPPPPVSGYAVAAGAQQNHVECAPTSPVVSVVPTRPVNHISSASTTVANSLSWTSSVPGNATDLSTHTNHFPGNFICMLECEDERGSDMLCYLRSHFYIFINFSGIIIITVC